MNKTAITVLQELMTKYSEIPTYECIAQTGPQHLSVFEYRCVAHGVTSRGVARSKKEAKQVAAWRALSELAARGVPVPSPYRTAPPPCRTALEPQAIDTNSYLPLPSTDKDANDETGEAGPSGTALVLDSRSYVALLKELCEEYRLGAVAYDLVGDTGPPHLRIFTVRAALGGHERVATASTKKAARQLAAEQLYLYLRKNLASATKDFVENRKAELLKGQSVSEKCVKNEDNDVDRGLRKRRSTDEALEEVQSKRCCDVKLEDETIVKESEEALNRAVDKAMSRYMEVREEQPRRPDLGQRIADYHLGVFDSVNEEQMAAASAAAADEGEDASAALQRTAAALGLSVELGALPAERGQLSVVSLAPAAPALVLAARDPPAAARAALRYLRRALTASATC